MQLGDQVQNALNLVLPMKNPAQMRALLKLLDDAKPRVQAALSGLHYVHFARFLPSLDGSALLVITEYDGDLRSYLMDFVAVLGPEFTAILEFIKDAPRLPVNAYPRDFCEFVEQNNVAQVKAWSAYPHLTVIDIQGPRRSLPPPVTPPVAVKIDLDDVQGNILHGYRVHYARHFALAVGAAEGAKKFIGGLVCGNESASPQVTTAAHWKERPEYFLNLGLTSHGLAALGLPAAILQRFPRAFTDGAAVRAERVGDTEASAPQNWILGHPSAPADLLLSLYADAHRGRQFEEKTKTLRNLFAQAGLKELSCHDATALPGGKVHFGYKDGIAQPRVAGAAEGAPPDMQPEAAAGEFLLGRQYVNQYGGNFLGDLPGALCDNATYAALRMLKQDVRAFDNALKDAGLRFGVDPEWVAAKLMGRWRDGSPLTLKPDAHGPATPPRQINEFDYAPSAEHPTYFDDAEGLRCPVGAHIRRLNPRSAQVTGKPHGRRIVRRGIPYGPEFDPARPDDGLERGLLGLFICGDLEMQYEFLMQVWANLDIQTRGLQGTRDPILGAQPPQGGKFIIRTEDDREPIELNLPRLVTTRGSLYLLVPGIGGLRYLASL